MKIFISIVTLMMITGSISAQSLFYSEYGENQGLENSEINDIVQDAHGFLWVGTENGLFRFDGYSFNEIIFSDINADKTVLDLAIDQNQNLWIASKSGLTSFNGARFNFLGTDRDHAYPSGSPKIMTAGKEIYFADGTGIIYQVQPKKLQKISDFFKDTKYRIIDWHASVPDSSWILTENGRVFLFTAGNLTGPMKAEVSFGEHPTWIGIHGVKNGSLEVITNKGILEISPDLKEEKYRARWRFRFENILTCYYDSGNNHWIVDNHFLRRINAGDTARMRIEINQGSKIIFFEDTEKNIWFSASGSGLLKFPGDLVTRWEDAETGNYTPTSYLVRGDEIWISYFGGGVKIYNQGADRTHRKFGGLISNYVRDMLLFRNETWFITARGVSRMNGSSLMHYNVSNGLPHNYCYKACIDDAGKLLVGTEQGLAVFENEKFRRVRIDDDMDEGRVKDLIQIKDGSVLVVRESIIDRYDGGNIHPLIRNGFSKKEVLNTAAEDQFGNYWIGSDMNGLFFFNPESAVLKHVSRERDLPFSRVRAIVPIGDRNLCIGTEKGIMYAEINEQGEITGFFPCGVEMGYPDFEVNLHAVMIHSDKVFFGTNMGTVLFHPEKLEPRSGGPVVNITGFDVSFKKTDWTRTSHQVNAWFNIPEDPVLNYEQNDLLFHFKGITLYSSDILWYKYKLENYDNTWSEPTRNGSAIYANLRPGNYTFHVQGSYDGFNWNDNSTAYALFIAPPFWKTWWFYVIMISFLLAGFILFNNYRIKIKINQLIAIEKLKKEEYNRIQKKVAMDFHDEVGNHLTSISLLVGLIRNNNWNVEKDLKDLLEKIDDESKNLFSGTRDFIWSIDPANDNLKAVYFNIRDYAIDLFENSSIHFQAENGNADIHLIKLPAGFARHIVLIFKEGLNNVLKHAGCRNVYFSMDIDGKDIEIKLRDDGKGFREQDLHYIEGIKKMKYRGAKIRSDLILNSDENMGTEIILKARV
jgi:signal transduction histidine kinase/ligand-binding sensor domain-containing protein